MAFHFVRTDVSEQHALRSFLFSSFNISLDVNSFRPDVLCWKYFTPHPEWKGTRSFIVKDDDNTIVAHGGVWPVSFITSTAEVRVINLIDWAGTSAVPGIGVLLLKRVAAMADVMLAVGGSLHTRQILPKLGYHNCGDLRMYAKVVRPWRQLWTTPSHNWKTPFRLVRNVIWSRIDLPPVPRYWWVEKITAFDHSMAAVINGSPLALTLCRRTIPALNHLLQCPGGNFSAFLLFQRDRLRGYFLLCQVDGQTRIADLSVSQAEKNDWRAACTLAAHTAAECPTTCEIVAASSISASSEAFLQAGFRLRRRDPINCYDPRGCLTGAPPLNINLADGDLCFLSDPAFPYFS